MKSAAAADFVFSSVTDDAALRAITSGADGILAGLEEGKVYVDMSTVSQRVSREVSEQVRSGGAEMLDAPVSGSIPRQRAERSRSWSAGTSRRSSRLSRCCERSDRRSPGSAPTEGLVLKLAINISLAVQVLAFSEGLLLAERDGVEPKLAAEVMAATPIGSPMLKARVRSFSTSQRRLGST